MELGNYITAGKTTTGNRKFIPHLEFKPSSPGNSQEHNIRTTMIKHFRTAFLDPTAYTMCIFAHRPTKRRMPILSYVSSFVLTTISDRSAKG
jgi:hypothetical protein